ncbi:MAG: tetratricopeptide repeat protein [Terracidiphilus sp.]
MTARVPQPRRVVLVGWGAADWEFLNPLVDAGVMPNLTALIDRGVAGRIAVTAPSISSLQWTSIITGVKPDRHAILGPLEPDPKTGSIRPVSSTSRKVKALWNILHHEGLRSVVVNWPAGHPAEPIRGAIVSDAYVKGAGPYGAEWSLLHGTVHPDSLAERLRSLRVHAGDLTGDDLALFIPNFERVDQARESRPAALASSLANSLSVHAAATWLMENQEWDFLVVLYDAIESAANLFLPFHPSAAEEPPTQDSKMYRGVVEGVYRYHDLLLGRLVKLAGPEAVTILISGQAVRAGSSRPLAQPTLPLVPASFPSQTFGILAMAGPGIRRDELIYGAEMVDVAPTTLNLFGMAPGKDMPGRTLAEAFENPAQIAAIPSWEDVQGDFGCHPVQTSGEDWDPVQTLGHLTELGYIDQPGQKSAPLLKGLRKEQDFTLARVYLAARRPADALPLFEELARENPDALGIQLHLAQCYYELGRWEECRVNAESALAKDSNLPSARLILANLSLREGRTQEALGHLQEAEHCSRPAPEISYRIGLIYLREKRYKEAARVFLSVLNLDPSHARAMAAWARTLLQQGAYVQAAEAALDTIRLRFDTSDAHFTLGVALAKTGSIARAIQAFESCLSLRPETPEAHRWLAAIHARITRDIVKSSRHHKLAKQPQPAHGRRTKP